MIRCSNCIDKEYPCTDCQKQRLAKLTKQLPLQYQIAAHVSDGWTWLGFVPSIIRKKIS